jgi:hypothetical protein
MTGQLTWTAVGETGRMQILEEASGAIPLSLCAENSNFPDSEAQGNLL